MEIHNVFISQLEKNEIDRIPLKDSSGQTTVDKSLRSHFIFHRLKLSGEFRVVNSNVK